MIGAGRSDVPLAIDAEGAAAVARCLSATRPALSQIYAEIGRQAPGRLRDFKIVTLGKQDIGEAFAAALLETAKVGVHRAFLFELESAGLLDLNGALAALGTAQAAPHETLLWPQDASGMITNLQGWDATVAGVVDVAALLKAVSQAERRICLVHAGEKEGTGFLIGPQTVLTNWHVMAPLIDPGTGLAREDSGAKISCEFENLTEGAKSKNLRVAMDWLVDFSPMVTSMSAESVGLDDMRHLRPHALDFCAIRLSGAPGRERGWYDLGNLGKLDKKTDHFFVFQHPVANPQRLGISAEATVDPDDRDVLRHRAWTERGSSGGLCLDHRFVPIALHHAAVTDQAKKFLFNRAIRLSAIHAVRPDLGAPDPSLYRIAMLADGSRAVLGREATQDLVQEMMRSAAKPILYVRGQARSGKSFTADLIRDCTPHDRRRLVRLSASELPVEALDLAQLILIRAGAAAAAIASLPKPDVPNGTGTAWVRATLLPALRLALSGLLGTDPAHPMILWLIIDELDLAAIPQTGARELLDALYADAEAMRYLRVVLIGLEAGLPGVDPSATRTDFLGSPDQIAEDALEACLGALMTGRMLAPTRAELRRQADLLAGTEALLQSMGKGHNRLERLSDVLAHVWLRSAQRWT